MHLIRDFLELIQALDYKALYILVDGLDETSLLPTPDAVTRFIQPLLTDLKLLDERQLAFKIFLPQHLEPYLTQHTDFRRKRLAIHQLTWSEADLLQSQRRLRSFSNANVSTMQIFCETELAAQPLPPDTAPRPPGPRRPLCGSGTGRAAHRLPRDLILRCRSLLEVYDARNTQDLIRRTDLEQANQADLGTDTPAARPDQEIIPAQGLYVDRNKQVWRDGDRLACHLRPRVATPDLSLCPSL